ncbi:Linalool 8-monooxygenase [Mycolicibacterium rhodesiae JS60]|nr:Linalool 8-monooxygenase [Mycolicibacterium rhodesiae JS60]
MSNFDHHDPDQVDERHPRLEAMLKTGCPINHNVRHGGFHSVARYRDLQDVVMNTKLFSSRIVSVPIDAFGNGTVIMPPIQLDPPAHGQFRKLMLPSFTPRSVAQWEAMVRENARSLVDGLVERGSCDAAEAFTRHIPTALMARMLGVAPEDEALFLSLLRRIVEDGGKDPEDAFAAALELGQYLVEAIERHKLEPADDLIGLMLDAEVDGDRLDLEGITAAAFLIVVAGIDTTYSVIGSALWHLAQNPEDRHRLITQPELMPVAVEEFLRFYAPAVLGRVVTEDTEYKGTKMVKDDLMLLCFPAANRDPEVFPDADKFIIDRPNNRHFAFGLGAHRCIGQSVARMEVRVALEEWLRRIPDFELDGLTPVSWATGPIWGPRELHLKW